MGHLGRAGPDEDDPEDQPGQQADQVGQVVRRPIGPQSQRPSPSDAGGQLGESLRMAVRPSPGDRRRPGQRTRAEPTITPSAKAATCAAWAPVETPSPTQIGRSVISRVRVTSTSAASPTVLRAPVTPMLEAAYTKPVHAEAVLRSRCGVELGATRKTWSRSLRSGGGHPLGAFVGDEVRGDQAGTAGLGQVVARTGRPHSAEQGSSRS
jgi:hypothetical protein